MGSADEHHGFRDGVIAGIPVSVAVAVGVLPMVVLFVESIGPGLSTANYGEVVGPLYRGTLLYSLGVGVAVTAICLSIAYPVTYWVAHRCPKRYRLGLLVALTLPLWLTTSC
jgi:ABC-type spermidine/putrescine transport system, permease component I